MIMRKRNLIIAVALGCTLAFAGLCGCSQQSASSDSSSTSTATASTSTPTPANPTIRLSTTTSVNDSGLLPYLQPYFEQATGYKLEITSAGTGAAIKKGETGDADLLLVHAKASEEEFISAGYGIERIPFMYNYFVVLGPSSDPAGVKNTSTATDAFKAIMDAKATFVSRGDDSGTNKAELKIWKAVGSTPDPATDTWYVSAGSGMGDTITKTAELQGYTMSDKATYLAHQHKSDLAILLGESDDLKNTYSLIAVNPDTISGVNTEGAQAFIDWMTSAEARTLIDEYGVADYGEPLFYTIDEAYK